MVRADKLPGQVTIRQIVMDVMEDRGIDNRFYKNMVRWAVRGFSQLSMFHIETYEEARLTPSALNVCTVPEDYVNWVAIGIPYNGRFWTLTRDNKIITTTTTSGQTETLDTEEGEGVIHGSSSYWHYGETGGKNQYTLNWINGRQFVVNGATGRTITLRYVSTGINATGDSSVSVLCQEALIAFVKRMYAEREMKSMVDLQYWENRWIEEQEKLRFAQFPSIDDIADAIYETYTQTVKR